VGGGRYDDAAALFDRLIISDDYAEFLTLPGYPLLASARRGGVARRGIPGPRSGVSESTRVPAQRYILLIRI
jgi:hypothetical protein